MFESMFPSHWTTLRKLMWLKLKGASAVWDTISGNPVSFSAKAAPLRQLKVAFSPVQSLNGYDAPWPAGGGKNLLDLSAFVNSPSASPNASYNAATDTLTLHGLVDYANVSITVPTTQNSDYTLSANFALTGASTCQFSYAIIASDNSTVIFNSGNLDASTTTGTTTFNTGANSKVYVRFYAARDIATIGGTLVVSTAMVEKGSSKTAFAPYSNLCPISGWSSLTVYHSGADTSDPRSISISLGQTVYSGYVDVISGVGNGGMDSVDMGTLDWNYSNNSGNWPIWMFFAPVPNTVNGFKRLCSIYPLFEGSIGNAPDKTMVLINNKVLYIRDDSYTDAATFKTAMSGVQLVYELATPIPIQLTPQEVQSLLGENVMWSDANGDLTVEYRSN